MELHYQPFVDLHTETLVGMEALVRWRHPTRGLLLPWEFISLAEDSGLIVPLGNWVLREACRQAAAWHGLRAGGRSGPGPGDVSVNVSAGSWPSRISDLVAEAIDASGVDRRSLWLEITESTLMRDPDEAVVVLQALRARPHISKSTTSAPAILAQLSAALSGRVASRSTGASSTSWIRAESTAIVRAIIGLGESLGLPVIAEGVERTAEVAAHRPSDVIWPRAIFSADRVPPTPWGSFRPTTSVREQHC